MKQQIASAFGHRERPPVVTTITVNSTLRDDARHFERMDWTQVAAKDWADFSDAFAGFAPEAFVYFLPSLMLLSLEKANLPLVAADSLVSALDTSGNPELWTDWFQQRFGVLTSTELRTLKDWAAVYLADRENGEGSVFARVQDTLAVLELGLEG